MTASTVRGYIRPEIEHLAVPIRSVHPYPGNARRGNHLKIRDSLLTHGQYKPLLVQRTTGHILVGNNTWHVAAGEQGWTEIAVQYLDVDDDAARRLLLIDNASSDTADYDPAALAELLVDLPDFDGTGFTVLDVDKLLADAGDYAALSDLPDVTTLLPVSPAGPRLPDNPTADPPLSPTAKPANPHIPAPQPGPIPTPAPTPDPSPTPPAPLPPADPRTTVLPPALPPTRRPRDPSPEQATWTLTLPPADRDEAHRLINHTRDWLDPSLPAAEIVLRALRTLAAVGDARHNPTTTINLTTLLMAAGRDPFTAL